MRVATLDQLEFVYYSLANTQVTNNNGVIVTDPERWQRFSERYRENIEYVMMLVSLRTLRINTGLLIRVLKGNCHPCVEHWPYGCLFCSSAKGYLALGLYYVCFLCNG